MVFGFRNGRRARPANRRAARRVLEPLERRDLMALVVGPLSFEQDVPFQGQVATFAAGDLQGTIADFKPTITWGDGSTSTDAQVIPNGPSAFAIIASKKYEISGTFPVGVMVAGTDNSAIFDSASATVTGAPLTPSAPSSIAATAGREFSAVVTSFTAPPRNNGVNDPGAAGYSASIDWGDGRTSPGVVSTPGEVGRFIVTGTHAYATAGNFLARVTIVRASDGLTLTTETPIRVYAFAGGLDPLSLVDRSAGALITNQQLPMLSGTAEPRSTIRLSMRRGLGGDPILLGETMADAAGRWSLVVGPMGEGPFYLYGTATPTSGSPLPTTLLNNGLPIVVDLHPARPVSATLNAPGSRVVVMVAGGQAGFEPIWLNRPDSYALIDAQGRSHHPTSVRAARAPRSRPGAPRPVVLSFARGSLPRDGEFRLNVTSPAGPASGGTPIASLSVGRGRR